jgi:hypothetical protein
MPSRSLQRWQGERSAALDEIEAAHGKVGGKGRGRRHETQQLNQAYALLLSSQFQGFCRDLHSEAVDRIVSFVQTTPQITVTLREQFTTARKLDRGNPNSGNIGSDFGRLGFAFWAQVKALGAHNAKRLKQLDALNEWRNAIAHHDFDPTTLGSTTLRLAQVRAWRTNCSSLARAFDEVVAAHLASLVRSPPW